MIQDDLGRSIKSSRPRLGTRFILAAASANRASPTSPQSRRRARQQRSIRSHKRLSALAILGKLSPRKAAATSNPHRRPGAHRFPAGSFFGGFRTPALCPVHRSRRASTRNPSRKRISLRDQHQNRASLQNFRGRARSSGYQSRRCARPTVGYREALLPLSGRPCRSLR
jgi:hypothetical protein